MDLLPFLGILGFAGIILAVMLWTNSRSYEILQGWAADNGFELVECEYRTFFTGPYFFRRSRGQVIYYVVVRDRDGYIRRGWVRCGGWFLGLLADDADVRWED